jgi:hypothetical protein
MVTNLELQKEIRDIKENINNNELQKEINVLKCALKAILSETAEYGLLSMGMSKELLSKFPDNHN